MKSAKQQADQASFVMNIPTQLECFCVKGTTSKGDVELGTFPLNIYDLLRKSEFYQSYANMYDEFKIDNIKVKLIPVSYNVTVGGDGGGYQSFTVYTAWDRTGLNSQQLLLETSGDYSSNPINAQNPNGPKMRDYIGKNIDNDGLYCIVGTDITTYSSAESRQVSVGQNSSIVRWLKPKTLAEKSQWLSTASLKSWFNQYSQGTFKYIPTFDNAHLSVITQSTVMNDRSVSTLLSSVSPAISNNPCFLEEDPTVNFKPTLLVGLYPAEEENVDHPREVKFNVEAEVSCTFRGLRKSKVVTTDTYIKDTPQVPTPTVQPNRVTVQINADQLDQIMEDANTKNITTRFGQKVVPEWGNLSINFASLPPPENCTIINPSGLNYATGLDIQLPFGSEATPIEINGVNVAFESVVPPLNDQGEENPNAGEVVRKEYLFEFGSEDWQGITRARIFNAKKHLRDGRSVETLVAALTIEAKRFMTIFKLSASQPGAYEFCTVYNNLVDAAEFIVELPNEILNDTRGWKDWLSGIYKGVCFVNRVIDKVDEYTGGLLGNIPVVGDIYTTVSTVSHAVEAVAAPVINLLDLDTQESRARRAETRGLEHEGPIFTLYNTKRDGEPDWNDPISPTDKYELSDDYMASFNGEFFEPELSEENKNRLMAIDN